MRKTEYACDNCGAAVADTKSGKIYGPLCIVVTAPRWRQGSEDGDFCSLECATLWLNSTLPRLLS